MKERKSSPAQLPFGKWPTSLLSHDVWAPDKTVNLSPFARVRERGEMENMTKSAIRSLDVLELMGQVGRPLRAVEIASALDLSPSSAHQLLKTMQDAAYLIFDPASKRYHPSMRATNFSGLLAESKYEPGAIHRLVRALHRALDTAVTISASQGGFMQIIDVFEPMPETPSTACRISALRQHSIGLRVPIFGSCTGAAWLLAQNDETVLATARLCRRALGERANDREHILEVVGRMRRHGYGFGGVSADDSRRAVAVPFPPARDGTVQVVTVSAPSDEMAQRREEIVKILKEQIVCHLGPA